MIYNNGLACNNHLLSNQTSNQLNPTTMSPCCTARKPRKNDVHPPPPCDPGLSQGSRQKHLRPFRLSETNVSHRARHVGRIRRDGATVGAATQGALATRRADEGIRGRRDGIEMDFWKGSKWQWQLGMRLQTDFSFKDSRSQGSTQHPVLFNSQSSEGERTPTSLEMGIQTKHSHCPSLEFRQLPRV